MLNAISLFTGIAGLDLAVAPWARSICYVENDPAAQAVIASNMESGRLPWAPILSDVREVPGRRFRGVADGIIAGSPCQGISHAGLRKGLDDERSSLFWEVIRLTKEVRPAFVFFENVWPGISRHVEAVEDAFARVGYETRSGVIEARDVGAPHIRPRFFLLAADVECVALWKQQRGGHGSDRQRAAVVRADVQQAVVADGDGDGDGEGQLQQEGSVHSLGGRIDHCFAECWFQHTDDAIRLLVHGLPFGLVEQRLLGNACVPAQARRAFEILSGSAQESEGTA